MQFQGPGCAPSVWSTTSENPFWKFLDPPLVTDSRALSARMPGAVMIKVECNHTIRKLSSKTEIQEQLLAIKEERAIETYREELYTTWDTYSCSYLPPAIFGVIIIVSILIIINTLIMIYTHLISL